LKILCPNGKTRKLLELIPPPLHLPQNQVGHSPFYEIFYRFFEICRQDDVNSLIGWLNKLPEKVISESILLEYPFDYPDMVRRSINWLIDNYPNWNLDENIKIIFFIGVILRKYLLNQDNFTPNRLRSDNEALIEYDIGNKIKSNRNLRRSLIKFWINRNEQSRAFEIENIAHQTEDFEWALQNLIETENSLWKGIIENTYRIEENFPTLREYKKIYRKLKRLAPVLFTPKWKRWIGLLKHEIRMRKIRQQPKKWQRKQNRELMEKKKETNKILNKHRKERQIFDSIVENQSLFSTIMRGLELVSEKNFIYIEILAFNYLIENVINLPRFLREKLKFIFQALEILKIRSINLDYRDFVIKNYKKFIPHIFEPRVLNLALWPNHFFNEITEQIIQNFQNEIILEIETNQELTMTSDFAEFLCRFKNKIEFSRIEDKINQLASNLDYTDENDRLIVDRLYYNAGFLGLYEKIYHFHWEFLYDNQNCDHIDIKRISKIPEDFFWEYVFEFASSAPRLVIRMMQVFDGEGVFRFDAYFRKLDLDMLNYIENCFFALKNDIQNSGDPNDFNPRLSRIVGECVKKTLELDSGESLDLLMKIKNYFPEYEWIDSDLETHKNKIRLINWNPVNTKELILYLKDDSRIIINTDEDLQKIILKSLEIIQQACRDEIPESLDFWNTRRAIYEPKDETDFSNKIKRELNKILHQQGIHLNREVLVQNGLIKGFIDIKCEVKTTQKSECVDYIEVKGCWNPEIETSIKGQLYEKYLKNKNHHHGIFLVVWALCDKWDNNDSRKRRTRSLFENKEALITFLQQETKNVNDKFQAEKVKIDFFVLDISLN
jgi:hypothetical protein